MENVLKDFCGTPSWHHALASHVSAINI